MSTGCKMGDVWKKHRATVIESSYCCFRAYAVGKRNIHEYSDTLWLFNIAMENGPIIHDL